MGAPDGRCPTQPTRVGRGRAIGGIPARNARVRARTAGGGQPPDRQRQIAAGEGRQDQVLRHPATTADPRIRDH